MMHNTPCLIPRLESKSSSEVTVIKWRIWFRMSLVISLFPSVSFLAVKVKSAEIIPESDYFKRYSESQCFTNNLP